MLECKKMISLISRNTKCYFKNKIYFFYLSDNSANIIRAVRNVS